MRALMMASLPKEDALAAARLAGTQAAKETARITPLFHAVPLTPVDILLRAVDNFV